jgi:hypothetical protein
MTQEKFIELLQLHEKVFAKFNELSDLGFDFYEGKYKLAEEYEKLFNLFLANTYTEEGIDWISWWICENDYGARKLEATDNGTPICYSVESLYEYTKQYLK